MSFLDNIIGTLFPTWQLRRVEAREAVRRYEAAGTGKRTRHRRGPSTSARAEVSMAGPTLRNKARQLRRNNPWAKRAIGSFANSVVGRGIKLTLDGTNQAATEPMKRRWKQWAESTVCDFYGKRNLYGLQRLIVKSAYRDGEVLVRKVREATNRGDVPLQLQVLEVDYLATSSVFNLASGVAPGNTIRDGIEFNRQGRVVAYHLYNTHPGDQDLRVDLGTVRVPADDILHIFRSDRPGQHRGVTELDTTAIRLMDFDDLEDATLIKQKVAASFSVFIHSNGQGRPGEDDEGYQAERIEPGMIERLAPGEQVSVAAPADSRDYQPYAARVLQGAAAGMLTSYEALTGDYSQVNFSSGRMGWIENQRFVEEYQDDVLIVQFCTPVWMWFKVAASISSSSLSRGDYSVNWTPPRREMLDPVKETEGIVKKLRARLISWQDAVREMGYDPDVLITQMVEDKDKFEGADLLTIADPAHDPGNAEPDAPAQQSTE
jgi:lambda family phage portal protein